MDLEKILARNITRASETPAPGSGGGMPSLTLAEITGGDAERIPNALNGVPRAIGGMSTLTMASVMNEAGGVPMVSASDGENVKPLESMKNVLRRYIPTQPDNKQVSVSLDEQRMKRLAIKYSPYSRGALQQLVTQNKVSKATLEEIQQIFKRYEEDLGAQSELAFLLEWARAKMKSAHVPTKVIPKLNPIKSKQLNEILQLREALCCDDTVNVWPSSQNKIILSGIISEMDSGRLCVVARDGTRVWALMNETLPGSVCPLCETMHSSDVIICEDCGLDFLVHGKRALKALIEDEQSFRHGWYLRRKGFKPKLQAGGSHTEFVHEKHGPIKIAVGDGSWSHGVMRGNNLDDLKTHVNKLIKK